MTAKKCKKVFKFVVLPIKSNQVVDYVAFLTFPLPSSELQGDVTPEDSQKRFLTQHSVAILEQCRNKDATLCCAKNRRCESSRVTSP